MSALELKKFMETFKSKEGGPSSNINSLPPNKGKWHIPNDQYSKFLELYAKAVEAKGIYQFTEQHEQYRPMVIDFDFKHINESNSDRIYTDVDVKNIVELYNDQIKHYFEIDFALCYVFEKPSGTKLQGDVLKDGIHLMYPDVISKSNVQLEIRENVIHQLSNSNILNHLNLKNRYEDIVDEAVLSKSGWMLYGSSKQDQYPYKLTHIYNLMTEKCVIPKRSLLEWIKLFSIRSYTSQDETKLKVEPTMKIKPSKTRECESNYINNTISRNTVEELVKILSIERSNIREKWIEVGICLYNINQSYIDIWINFSKQSDKFVEGECEKHWSGFNPQKPNKLQIPTLHYWARNDNIDEYNKIKKQENANSLMKSLDGTHFEVANLLFKRYGNQYVCADIRKNTWYKFDSELHCWKPEPNATRLRTTMSIELDSEYKHLSETLKRTSMACPDDPDAAAKVKACSKLVKNVKDNGFKKSVLNECNDLFYNADFLSNLDINQNLIGFTNGVYDLEKKEFRPGKPDDYISMSTGHDYQPYSQYDPNAREILRFIKQIMPDPEVEKYLLKLIASFLHGSTGDQKFHIWTGSGSNGKSKLLDLIEESFGDYSMILPVTVMTHKRAGPSAPNPEMAKTKGKRFVSFQEPEKDDKIHVGFMKQLSGGDTIMARGLHESPIEFKPMFKAVLACNDLPEITSNDGGTWRRLRVVHFPCKFVENPNPNNPLEHKIDRDIPNKIKKWAPTFLSLLIHRFTNYKEEGIKAPPAVMKFTEQYRLNNDIFLEYIKENIDITENDKDHILINDGYLHFRMWYQDSFGKKPSSRAEFRSYLDSYFGASNSRYGWRKIAFKQNSSSNIEENSL
uniref:SF3 helicase domain-containing protein n=1 Tax=viral metagenome TaxID=1070528 RepID=A0A6C0F628_9ZZZZ|tara:strand:+ start:3218 stop:5773 length:2556 start_codon:yes stop_codon:yes gene_type:complete